MKKETIGIPIRVTDYSNSSQVVSLFTPDRGLVDGLAKGAHRLKNPFQGPFDLATLYEFRYLERANGLAILTDATVVDGFRALRRASWRYVATCHVIELLRVTGTHADEAFSLFDLVVATLERLESTSSDAVEVELVRFDLRALRTLGLLPPVDACVLCGRAWPESARRVFFSVENGGLVCRSCRARQAGIRGRDLPGGAVRVLRDLSQSELAPKIVEILREPWRVHRESVTHTVRSVRTRLLERELTALASARRLR